MYMYHPNAELEMCTNCTQELKTWDQRIPNEPIFERNFLIQRPPPIHINYPQSTTPCIKADPNQLLLNQKLQRESAAYWDQYLRGKSFQGLPVTPVAQTLKKGEIKKIRRQRPDRPWIYGTNINIDAESKLFSLNYYNPTDCINKKVRDCLERENREASVRMHMRHHRSASQYLNKTPHWINNPTRMINQEPIDYNYTGFLDKCAARRHLPHSAALRR